MTDRDGHLAALAALNEPQRRRIYRHVAEQDAPVSRDATAAALGIPRSVAAFHLEKLAELGLLETEFRRPPGRSGPGAGRPAKLYRRAEAEVSLSVPERHYDLAALVLAQAVEAASDGSTPVATALQTAARSYGESMGAPLRGATPGPDGKLESLRALLADHGYEPQVEGEHITLRNCPFHALAEEHRALVCGINQDLLSGVVDAAGLDETVACLDPEPGRCCVVLRPA